MLRINNLTRGVRLTFVPSRVRHRRPGGDDPLPSLWRGPHRGEHRMPNAGVGGPTPGGAHPIGTTARPLRPLSKLFPLFPPPYGARDGASVEIEEGFSKELGQTKDWMYLL